MNISEYASRHGLRPQYVSSYIKRHSDMFEGHTRKEANSLILDDVAVELLDKKYPYPLEQVGVAKEEHEKVLQELALTKAMLTQSQKDLSEQIKVNVEYQKLLEAKEKELKALEDKRKTEDKEETEAIINKASKEAKEWFNGFVEVTQQLMDSIDREQAERDREANKKQKESFLQKVFSNFGKDK